MRIVFDTQSRGWAIFKRWSVGVLIILLIMVVGAIIDHFTGWKNDFTVGVLVAVHSLRYKWMP